MAEGVRRFGVKEGKERLPLNGTIPDMTADTSTYVQLQQIYAQQAAADVAAAGILKEGDDNSDSNSGDSSSSHSSRVAIE